MRASLRTTGTHAVGCLLPSLPSRRSRLRKERLSPCSCEPPFQPKPRHPRHCQPLFRRPCHRLAACRSWPLVTGLLPEFPDASRDASGDVGATRPKRAWWRLAGNVEVEKGPDGEPWFVGFEWIGRTDYLNEWLRTVSPKRGANVISADAVLRFRQAGRVETLLVEWQYTESYGAPPEPKREAETRSPLQAAESSSSCIKPARMIHLCEILGSMPMAMLFSAAPHLWGRTPEESRDPKADAGYKGPSENSAQVSRGSSGLASCRT